MITTTTRQTPNLTLDKTNSDLTGVERQSDIEQGKKKQKEDREAMRRFRTKWNLILPNRQDRTKHKMRTPTPIKEQEEKTESIEHSKWDDMRTKGNTEVARTTITEANNEEPDTQGGKGNDTQEGSSETKQRQNTNSIQLNTIDIDTETQDEAQVDTDNQNDKDEQDTTERKRNTHEQTQKKRTIRANDKQKKKARTNKAMTKIEKKHK